MADTLVINEIFFSIQGESRHAGRPCVFVRLAYCNLRCTWCDTAYAFHEGQTQTFDQILETIAAYPCHLVEVTGGEPLAQENCRPFLSRLCDEGWEVLLETSGSLDITRVDPRVSRIIDVKCPGSGMADRNSWNNLDDLRTTDEAKFVILDRADFDWALEVISRHHLLERCPVLVSPVFGKLPPRDLAEWILESGLPLRMQLQLHKFIWDPQQRGV